MTDATLYFFTDLGQCYPLAVTSLQEANRPKDRGLLPSGLLAGLSKGEQVVAVLCLRPGELEAMPDLLFVTCGGQIKRSEASAYAVKKARFAALTLRADDKLLAVLPAECETVLLLTRQSAGHPLCRRSSARQWPDGRGRARHDAGGGGRGGVCVLHGR